MAMALPATGIRRPSGLPSNNVRASDHPSPNCGPRRRGALPDMVVIHYTGMAFGAEARLCDPDAEVSAHWLITADGVIKPLVPEELRAWHAGAGSWGAVTDVNSHSIGIELDNPGDRPFAARQMAALERLLADILHRWAIPPERVIAHSDMAPARKTDPGPRFDWQRLARRGLAVWPEPDGEEGNFVIYAHAFGYPQVAPEVMLAAFRLRFRPGVTGPEDATDRRLIRNLATRFPVDARLARA